MIRGSGMEDNPDRADEYPDPASRHGIVICRLL